MGALRRAGSVLVSTVLAGVVVCETAVQAAADGPGADYQMPFPCGETWAGSTRFDHSPSPLSIDWNRPSDEGSPVVASAAGIVTTADALNQLSYGHHVVLDHGNGETTIYAHLDQVFVSEGQYVDQGTLLGTVGNTGRSFGAHLHFEQRRDKHDHAASFAGVPYVYGQLTSYNCGDVPLAGNFVGDAVAEVATYRRGKESAYVIKSAKKKTRLIALGDPIDEPVLGDWDGDGTTDVGIYRTMDATFELRTFGGVVEADYGLPGDRPLAGDWDGNGVDEVAVFRPLTATFYLLQADGSTESVVLGDVDDIPVAGDWDGDRTTDLGVYDTATNTYTLRYVARGEEKLEAAKLGGPGDLPVVGDWDGDGTTDLGVWTPAAARFTQADESSSVAATRIGPYLPARRKAKHMRFGAPR